MFEWFQYGPCMPYTIVPVEKLMKRKRSCCSDYGASHNVDQKMLGKIYPREGNHAGRNKAGEFYKPVGRYESQAKK